MRDSVLLLCCHTWFCIYRVTGLIECICAGLISIKFTPLVLYVPSDRPNIMHMCVPQCCCVAECTQQLVSLSLRSIVFGPQLHVHCRIHAFFLSVKQDISPRYLHCTFPPSFLGFKVQNCDTGFISVFRREREREKKDILKGYVTTGRILLFDPAEYISRYSPTMEVEIASETLRLATKAERCNVPNMHVILIIDIEYRL